MDIVYEWDIEEVDSETFETLEHDHNWSLKGLSHYALTLGENPDIFHRLVLVRDEFRGHNRVNRSWCYVTDRGTLPKTTDNGYEIPKKYKAEFDKNKSWASKLRNRIRS